jgi:hypothetical protein
MTSIYVVRISVPPEVMLYSVAGLVAWLNAGVGAAAAAAT